MGRLEDGRNGGGGQRKGTQSFVCGGGCGFGLGVRGSVPRGRLSSCGDAYGRLSKLGILPQGHQMSHKIIRSNSSFTGMPPSHIVGVIISAGRSHI